MIGDCPNFPEPSGTVPFSEIILLDALKVPECQLRISASLSGSLSVAAAEMLPVMPAFL
jgi:hypothetical protein